MGRHGVQDPSAARPRRADDRHLSWKRRAASAVTTSAVVVGLGTLAYGSTHTYLGFISDPPRHESAPGNPAPPPSPSPSISASRPGSAVPERPREKTRATARPSAPSPSATPRPRVSATPKETPTTRRTPEPSPAPKVIFDYETKPRDDGRFGGSVTIRNLDDEPIQGWRLSLDFSSARIGSVLDSLGEPTLDGLVAGGLLGPPPIAPGESLTISFTAEGDATGGVTCSFNDTPCTLT